MGEIAAETSVARSTTYAEFPLRIRLATLDMMTSKIAEELSLVGGDLVLEVDSDRGRLTLRHYPDYQEDVP